MNYQLVLRSNNLLQNTNEYSELWCLIERLLCCDRFDGDCLENNPEAAMDKSKSWSRSIEDLHGGSTLPSPITGNGLTRVARHSTLRYSAHAQLMISCLTVHVCLCVLCNLLTAQFTFILYCFLSCLPLISRSHVAVV